MPTPVAVSDRNTAGSIRSMRCRATAMYVSRTAGSLSWVSAETQPTLDVVRSAHWANKVVLPYPGGATTEITGDEPCGDQPLDQVGPRHDPWPGHRRMELGVGEVEGELGSSDRGRGA